MKAERNQDGTYTVLITESELIDMKAGFSIFSSKLLLEKPEGGEWLDWSKGEQEWRESLSKKLSTFSRVLLDAYAEAWYADRRLRSGEVPARKAA